MRVARVRIEGSGRWCVLEGDSAFAVDGDVFLAPVRGESLGPISGLELIRPVTAGSTVVCLLGAWKNLADRDGPSFFVKPQSSLIDPGADIVYPNEGTRVVYEPELAVVIGRRTRRVTPEQARAHVFGYTCMNDVTALEFGRTTNFPFLPGKSFDTFGSIGPWIETALEPDDVGLSARIDGRMTTDTRTSKMLWTTDQIVSWVSQFMTLEPGDLISCGTPPEYEEISVGVTVEVTVEGIGTLVNPVVAEGS